MAVVVINRIRLRIPVDRIAPDVEREFPAAFRGLAGFERFSFVKLAETEVAALIVWDSAEHAQAGADAIGPTLFGRILAPHTESQDRVVGEILVEVTSQRPVGGVRH